MSHDPSRILDKIKKLMALANSSNPHEAANALRKAQALMSQHQLTQLDVELSAIGEQSAKMANKSLKQPKWSVMLTSLICQAFGVEAYTSHSLFGCSMNFIGRTDLVEVAAYCYTVLSRQLVKARKEYQADLNKRLKQSTKTARADLFCEGWVYGVYQIDFFFSFYYVVSFAITHLMPLYPGCQFISHNDFFPERFHIQEISYE